MSYQRYIEHERRWFITYAKINRVTSHQDDKICTITEIPLDAYLNSEADELEAIGSQML